MKERQFSGDAAQLESSGHRSTRQSHDSSFFLFKKLERNEEKDTERQRERETDEPECQRVCVCEKQKDGVCIFFRTWLVAPHPSSFSLPTLPLAVLLVERAAGDTM